MQGMTVGGVDPSILRELSGVYKPFIKAFKELISNAYDADADHVAIKFADDFSNATVTDDGTGMSPFEFRYDFTRIGGSSRRSTHGVTQKGRPRIGNKGIGFLALARYCDQMIIESSRPGLFRMTHRLERTPGVVDLRKVIGVPVSQQLLQEICKCSVRKADQKRRLGTSKLKYDWKRSRVSVVSDLGPVDLEIEINCRNLGFKATLDFARLLKLADTADLEKLSDFALIEVTQLKRGAKRGTTITVEGIKGFVKRELRADRRKGYVRNVASRGGLEQLVWHLSRCTPVKYDEPIDGNIAIKRVLQHTDLQTLKNLELTHGNLTQELRRPVYSLESTAPPIVDDMITIVDIKEGGLRATGFLAGYEGIIFPAEYRGVSIRVRGVAIGDPTFLGAEYLLTGAHKAALSQITGEINVVSGLDAVDSLNPGRESFYEESQHFQILRRYFRGEGERVGGYLGSTVAAVLRRSQTRSSLNGVLGRASCIRHAIDDVSAGVSHLVSRGGAPAIAIRNMLRSKKSHTNGLASRKDAPLGLPNRVAGMVVKPTKRLHEPATIDYGAKEIAIDVTRPEWDTSIVLFKRRFAIIHKLGTPTQSIAEIDFQTERIFINWGHPAKSQMDERGFLRTALSWLLARTAAQDNADQMMNLAIVLLSFSTQSND